MAHATNIHELTELAIAFEIHWRLIPICTAGQRLHYRLDMLVGVWNVGALPRVWIPLQTFAHVDDGLRELRRLAALRVVLPARREPDNTAL